MGTDFGDVLRDLRCASGLTQEQLAEASGLSVEGISALERGQRKRARVSTVDALVAGLELDPEAALQLHEARRAARHIEPVAPPDPAPRQVRPHWNLRPAQLPAPPATYVGREDVVAELLSRLRRPSTFAPDVVSITGMAGIGKTSLALRLGHAVAEHYPDGQIYLDLRGHHPAGQLSAREALGYLLTSLGVHPDDVPLDVHQAAAYYRTLTSGTRLLMVLDDAADASQVDLLMPGTAGSSVILVSRTSLSGGPAAATYQLGRLDPRAACDLLGGMVGVGRMEADDEAAQRLVAACAGLPLALRIVGARLQSRPSWAVADLADRLSDSGALAQMQCGGLAVESALGESIEQLTSSDDEADRAAAVALTMIGLLPTYAVSPIAVGAACGWAPEQARIAIDRLVDANLVEESVSGPFVVHDLVHAVAQARARDQVAPSERHAVRLRVLQHYTAIAWRSRQLSRAVPVGIDAEALTASLDPRLDASDCLELISDDADQVVALARSMVDHDADSALIVGRLVLGLITYFVAHADNARWPETVQMALRHLPDDAIDERIWLHQDLALAHSGRGEHAPSLRHAEESARLARAHRRPLAEGPAHTVASIALRRLDRLQDAIDSCHKGLELCRQHGDERATAAAWREVGLLEAENGDLRTGIKAQRTALELYRKLEVPRGIAMALINLGVMLRESGDMAAARRLLEEGVEVSRSVGDRALETEALDELGYWHVVVGDPRGGITVLSDGLALVDDRGAGQWEASIRRRLGLALDGLGRHDEADEHWQAAIRRHEQRGELRQAAEVRQLWAARRVSINRTGPTRAATNSRTSSA